MKKILLIITINININADIIYMTIKKEENQIEVKYTIKNDIENKTILIHGHGEKYKGNKIYTFPIANRFITKEKIIYKYKKLEILNRKEIKKSYMKLMNNIKIKIDKEDYLQTFKILAKPNRPRNYWQIIEKKYKTYDLKEIKKIVSKEKYNKIIRELNL